MDVGTIGRRINIANIVAYGAIARFLILRSVSLCIFGICDSLYIPFSLNICLRSGYLMMFCIWHFI